MLIVLVTLATTLYILIHFQKRRKFPTLQAVLLVSLAVVAVIQNIKFFYLIFFPSFEILPWIGKPLSQGFGLIQIPLKLKPCLELVGSDFDRFNLALGPVAVIWLSIKQILELTPGKSGKQSSNRSKNNPPSSPPPSNP